MFPFPAPPAPAPAVAGPPAPRPLNTRQLRALDAVAAAVSAGNPPATIAGIYAAAGISRATYFRWSRLPAFHAAITRMLCEPAFTAATAYVAADHFVGRDAAAYDAFRRSYDFVFDRRSQALCAAMSGIVVPGARLLAPTLLARHAGRQLLRQLAANPASRRRVVESAPLKTRDLAAKSETFCVSIRRGLHRGARPRAAARRGRRNLRPYLRRHRAPGGRTVRPVASPRPASSCSPSG